MSKHKYVVKAWLLQQNGYTLKALTDTDIKLHGFSKWQASRAAWYTPEGKIITITGRGDNKTYLPSGSTSRIEKAFAHLLKHHGTECLECFGSGEQWGGERKKGKAHVDCHHCGGIGKVVPHSPKYFFDEGIDYKSLENQVHNITIGDDDITWLAKHISSKPLFDCNHDTDYWPESLDGILAQGEFNLKTRTMFATLSEEYRTYANIAAIAKRRRELGLE